METLAIDVEKTSELQKEKKGSLMRKSSLKKVSEGATSALVGLRPSSKGKLASLSKRESIGSRGDMLELKI